jgi:hypothetical protein
MNAEKLFGGSAYEGEQNVVCPACGFDYTHINRVYTRLGTDEYEAGVYEGTQVNGTTPYRRSALVVEFDGECGHTFRLVIQQHKGINIADVEIVHEEQVPGSGEFNV